jgi:hypothetical protein
MKWLTFEFTGDARLYRAASGGMMGWAFSCETSLLKAPQQKRNES